MKKAIISGASSGIGEALAQTLLELGYEVIGISRTTNTTLEKNQNFTTMHCDLSDEAQTVALTHTLRKNKDVSLLINCAGFGAFAPHEELHVKEITTMVALNLTAPMLLTNALLRTLKKNDGYLININSVEALRASKFAGVYSATKAGLKAFTDALFEETRKSNLSVTNINPDMTQTPFYDNLRFDVSDNTDEKLLAQDISEALKHILSMRKGAVISEYTIRSLHFGIKKKTPTK